MQEWKYIRDYEGLYKVSNHGEVLSVKRTVVRRDGKSQEIEEQILSQRLDSHGYYRVNLRCRGSVKTFRVHQLVAEAFCPNPQGYSIVNHRDENPKNNNADNLEWCNQGYNINYGTRNQRVSLKMKDFSSPLRKRVIQCKKDGTVVRVWSSTHEAGEVGFHQSTIVACANGKRKSHKGFIWKYEE